MTRSVSTAHSTARRKLLIDALAGAGAAGLLPLAGATGAAGKPRVAQLPANPATPAGGMHDFDFFVGHWHGTNRRLKRRWAGSDDWDVFPGDLRCESRMGGGVNIDEVRFATKGWSGMTVRIFNPAKRQWALYWINSITGELFPPVLGGFDGRHGEFYGDDSDEGRPVKVRFRWKSIDADNAYWEQAFSLDGKEWEINWTCDFKRMQA
ncbi:hypothetical protein [Luteimonas aquatica]|uniref:hypothetical protein n=1 Tax=Luteimonas aquatica TaxID=450364 RepID=UPI001F5ABB5A|nr:hypothetical protein [Luteimonas aquatica]